MDSRDGYSTILSITIFIISAQMVVPATLKGRIEPAAVTTAVKRGLLLSLKDDSLPATVGGRTITSCMAFPPSGGQVPLVEGGSTPPRFTFQGSFEKGECGLRIQPVQKDDHGEWRLKMVYKKSTDEVLGTSRVTVEEYLDQVGPNNKPSIDEGGTVDLVLYPIRPVGNYSVSLSSCVAVTPSKESVTVAPNGKHRRILYIQDNKRLQTLKAGWCGVRIKKVAPEDHGLWVIEATDLTTGVVYRGPATINVWVPQMQAVPAAVVAGGDDEAIVRMLPKLPSQARPWKLCQAEAPDGTLYHLAGEPRGSAVADPRVNFAGDSIANGDCGMSLQLTTNFTGKWTLLATRPSGSVGKAQADVKVLGPYKPSGNQVTVTLGQRDQRILCGPGEAVSCRLTDPAGEVAQFSGPCEHTIDNVRAKHVGTWRCTASSPGYLLEVQDFVHLNLTEDVHTELGATWQADSVLLTCRVRNAPSSMKRPSWCRLEKPGAGGAVVLLQEGVVARSRFKYAGEGFRKFDCSAKVSRPLSDAEVGVWRCTMGSDVTPLRPMGGLINVFPEGSAIPPPTAFPVRSPLSGAARNASALSVGCRADRPLAYCWLRSPAGELLMLHDSFASGRYRSGGSGLQLGECVVDVKPADSALHSGTWTCGMGIAGQRDSAPDLQLAVDMHVSDSLLAALTDSVQAARGSWATLGCATVTAESITYCRFQRPDGLSIHVADTAYASPGGEGGSSTSRADDPAYAYSGTGLQNGSCGLFIRSAQAEDFGAWTCSAGLAGDINGREQSAGVTLVPEPEGQVSASVIGIAVGLVIAGLLAGALVGYRYFAYHHTRYHGCESELLDVTSASAERRSPPPSPQESPSPALATRGTQAANHPGAQSRRRSRQ